MSSRKGGAEGVGCPPCELLPRTNIIFCKQVQVLVSIAFRHQKRRIVLSHMLLLADSQAHGSSDILIKLLLKIELLPCLEVAYHTLGSSFKLLLPRACAFK